MNASNNDRRRTVSEPGSHASERRIEGVDRGLTAYGDRDFSRFLRRAFLASAGFDDEDLDRPVVGIVDTSSDFTTCHRAMPDLVDAVRRGVLEAGGLPFVLPAMSLGEIFMSPTAMLYRNLMAMEVEEQLKAYPMDAAVLLGGCDKTVPAQLMAAASADVPALHVVSGSMSVGSWRGERVGACTDCRRFWARFRGGDLSQEDIEEVRTQLAPTAGTCMVMGTASTMACVTEALGMMLPRGATAPAVSADRLRCGVASGRAAVALAGTSRTPRSVLTRSSFENAMVVLAAIAGSTNGVLHLTAIAGRVGIELTPEDFSRVARRVPVLVDVKPTGAGYLPDVHDAGGVPALLRALEDLLDLEAPMVEGGTLGDRLAGVVAPQDCSGAIRPLAHPVAAPGALVALRGSLAPDGALIKASAASDHLLRHEGPAAVFDSPEDLAARIDDPELGLTADHVLILRNIGPIASGMPEAGALPIPRYLAAQGVKDMVRISDGRMSGTAYGTVVLHCAPEAAAGGPLALVRDGDAVVLDVADQRLDVLVDPKEWEERRRQFVPRPLPERGWNRLYAGQVQQAPKGVDLEFLV